MKLTNIIEAILFASGKSVPLSEIAEKLGVSMGEVKKALEQLKERFSESDGIHLLTFNNKAQLASNPVFKDEVASVLNPIREKELTRTILECAAIIAYKQPITKTEIEMLRGTNSDYAVRALLDLQLIYPCGKKDAVGRPILYATTDEFLKRFKLNSLEDLPDYETLMEAIVRSDERDNYLYAREEYGEITEDEVAVADSNSETKEKTKKNAEEVRDGYEIPDMLSDLNVDEIVKII